MAIRKNTIWTVPLFCIAAGAASFFLVAFGVGRFAVVIGPDGSRTSDTGRVLLIYGLLLAAALIIGGLCLFCRMTRREIALSATVTAGFQLLLTLAGYFLPMSSSLSATVSFLSMISEWSSFVPMVMYEITDSYLVSSLVGAFVPYLFVLFGKKSLE